MEGASGRKPAFNMKMSGFPEDEIRYFLVLDLDTCQTSGTSNMHLANLHTARPTASPAVTIKETCSSRLTQE